MSDPNSSSSPLGIDRVSLRARLLRAHAALDAADRLLISGSPIDAWQRWRREHRQALCDEAQAPDSAAMDPLAREAILLIARERDRQIRAEGWTLDHDDRHTGGEIAMAASCYALPESKRRYTQRHVDRADNGGRDAVWFTPAHYPWSEFKATPNDRVRELVKAGALIVAEIERLQRLALVPPASPTATEEEKDPSLPGTTSREESDALRLQPPPDNADEGGSVPAHVICPFCRSFGMTVADNIVYRACERHQAETSAPRSASLTATGEDHKT